MAAAIAKKAQKEGTSLREAALALGHLTAEQFDAWGLGEGAVLVPLLHSAGWWLFWPSLLLALSSAVGYLRAASRG